jgi:hypothetical protein
MVYRTSAFGLLALALLVSGVSVSASQRMTGVRESQVNDGINSRRDTQLLAQQPIFSENKYFSGVLQSCTRSGSSVKCSVVIRSKEDTKITILCQDQDVTKLYDAFGNLYLCSQIQIGNRKEEGRISSRFPQGAPVKVTLTFNNIPSQIREFDTFELHTHISGNYSFLRFPNVKISG